MSRSAIEIGNQTSQAVLTLEPGRIIEIQAQYLRNYYDENHNPMKGETANGELERWISFLWITKRIKTHYDYNRDVYAFRNFSPIKRKPFPKCDCPGYGYLIDRICGFNVCHVCRKRVTLKQIRSHNIYHEKMLVGFTTTEKFNDATIKAYDKTFLYKRYPRKLKKKLKKLGRL